MLVVVVAHLPYLTGLTDPDPLAVTSRLATARPGLLPGRSTIDPNYGYTTQALGRRAALEWLDGNVPWWNPYEGAGAPLVGGMQSAAFFPPTLLLALPDGLLLERMLLEVIAACAAFALLRRLGVRTVVAVGVGAVFGLNGTFAWFQNAPVNAIAFLPLALVGVERVFDAAREGRRGDWWLLAVATALSIAAGFPETAALDGAFVAAWALWRAGGLSGSARRRLMIGVTVGGAVGVVAALPVVVPFLDYLRYGEVGVHAGGADQVHLPGRSWPALVLPYVFGPILGFQRQDPSGTIGVFWHYVGGYLTVPLVALAAVGAFGRRLRSLRMLCLAWIAISLGISFGVPLVSMLGRLPILDRVVFYRYAPPTWELAAVVLAGLGVDDIVAGVRRRGVAPAVLAIGLTTAALAFASARSITGHITNVQFRVVQLGTVTWAVVAVALAATLALSRRERTRALVAVVLAADAAVMFALPALSAPRSVRVDERPVRFLQEHAGLQRVFTLGPLQPNYGSYYGVAQANVNDVPIPAVWAAYIKRSLDPDVDPFVFVGTRSSRPPGAPSPADAFVRNVEGYRRAGVRYVLTGSRDPAPEVDGLEPVAQFETASVYELTGWRAYFDAGPSCVVAARSRTRATIECTAPATLVRLEADLPGWRATVNGRPVRIGRADETFQSVELPAGRSAVAFDYRPAGMVWFLLITLGAWLAIARDGRARRRVLVTGGRAPGEATPS